MSTSLKKVKKIIHRIFETAKTEIKRIYQE